MQKWDKIGKLEVPPIPNANKSVTDVMVIVIPHFPIVLPNSSGILDLNGEKAFKF